MKQARNILVVVIGILLAVNIVLSGMQISNAAPAVPVPADVDSQGRISSNASIFVYGVPMNAFHLEWSSANEANSWSYIDPNGCNFDPICASNGTLLWNGLVKQSLITVYTANDPGLTCWVCAVTIDHYKYPISDQFYRQTVNAGGYWITTFSNYP